MVVYILSTDEEIVGVYYEYIKAYDTGCKNYNGNFDIEEFDIE